MHELKIFKSPVARGLFPFIVILVCLFIGFRSAVADTTSLAGPDGVAAPAVLHETDLFRPYADPDDHWDLACLYALTYEKRLDLKEVLIDFPPRKGLKPDITAVKQMNFITGLNVPFVIGSSHAADNSRPSSSNDAAGVEAIAQNLRNAPQGLFVDICGSCRDVAAAIRQYPDLFRDKCRGVYLNAGRGDNRPPPNKALEYNVTLDPKSYATIFQAHCPVYWMPCFGPDGYQTFYNFQQGEILPFLSADARRFFVSMLTKNTTTDWMTVLKQDQPAEVLKAQNQGTRNMWCTPEFFNVAGLGVDSQGKIRPLAELGKEALYEFEPIRIECNEKGEIEWDPDPTSKDRFIFHVLDQKHYSAAMTQAMKTLLQALP